MHVGQKVNLIQNILSKPQQSFAAHKPSLQNDRDLYLLNPETQTHLLVKSMDHYLKITNSPEGESEQNKKAFLEIVESCNIQTHLMMLVNLK